MLSNYTNVRVEVFCINDKYVSTIYIVNAILTLIFSKIFVYIDSIRHVVMNNAGKCMYSLYDSNV